MLTVRADDAALYHITARLVPAKEVGGDPQFDDITMVLLEV